MTPLSRRQFGKWTALAASAASFGGCAPWECADFDHQLDRLLDELSPSPLEWRVLNRLAFGPRTGDLSRLRARGVETWIDEQLTPELVEESPDLLTALGSLETLELSPDEAREREIEWEPDLAVAPIVKKLLKYGKPPGPEPGPVQQQLAQATVLRAAFSARSLQEVMVEFWSDHFNIDESKGDCRWLKAFDDDGLRRHALGRFRELLGASVHSPAMLFYLDNAQNCKRDPSVGLEPNENYARELLELHTVGDTSAYTFYDVQEVARVLTGWTIGDSRTGTPGEFIFRAENHDDGEKTVFGQRLPAGHAPRDGEQLLDLLAAHPLTARTVVGKLCYRFLGVVPAGLQERLSRVFLATDGSIRHVLAELFHSEEFRRGDQPQFKRPFHFAVSALRMLGARTSGAGIVPYLESMGQRPFRWAQPDGYPARYEPWTAGLLARWNFAIDLARNQIDETWINLDALARATRGRPPADVCRQLSSSLLAAPLTGCELDSLIALDGAPADMLPQWLALLLMSPRFQWC